MLTTRRRPATPRATPSRPNAGAAGSQLRTVQLHVARVPPTPRAGYGGCYRCGCRAFEGLGNICGNCGHAYKDHC